MVRAVQRIVIERRMSLGAQWCGVGSGRKNNLVGIQKYIFGSEPSLIVVFPYYKGKFFCCSLNQNVTQ